MATGATRDDAALEAGLAGWIDAQPDLVRAVSGTGAVADSGAAGCGGTDGERPRLVGLSHAQGGQANETILVDLGPSHRGNRGAAAATGAHLPRLRARTAGAGPERRRRIGCAGTRAGGCRDRSRVDWRAVPGHAAVAGDIPGPAPFFDPYVRDAGSAGQRIMHDRLLDVVADVHAVDWAASGLAAVLPGGQLRDAVARWVAYVEWSSGGDPLPALAQALDWCARHVPAERAAVLLWGDVRMGNLVFDPERRVTAVLDWDLASLGPREMDLGWHFGLEFMMEALFGGRVPGFPGPAEAVERYERRTGHEVRDLAWHEVFALARALAINDRHQRITGATRRRENPMGDILLARLAAASAEVG